MKQKIKSILSSLDEVKENLLSLSDDIWLSINHNDNTELQEGITFKTEFNNKLTELDKLSSEIAVLVEQFAGMSGVEKPEPAADAVEVERIIKELNRFEPHNLSEDFMYKRPYGFVFKDRAFKDLGTWRNMYLTLLTQLHDIDQGKFESLTSAEEFISKKGNSLFSADGEDLRFGREVDGIHVELNLSANSIRDAMKKVLDYFGYNNSDMVVYLREDRNFEGRGR